MSWPKAPALRYLISGQSIVTIDCKDLYIGKRNSAESIAESRQSYCDNV